MRRIIVVAVVLLSVLTGCSRTETRIEEQGNNTCVRVTDQYHVGIRTSHNEYIFRCTDGAIVAGNN